MPAAFVTTTLTAMLAGPLGDAFVFGAQSTRCLFDDSMTVVDDEMGMDVARRVRMATIRTGSVTALAEDSAVTVAGVAYTVRKILPAEDGLLTRVLLARVDEP